MRIFFLYILFFSSLLNYSQDFQWVRDFNGSYFSGENASVIEVDDNENSYTFGMIFEPIFDIDPTSGTHIIDNTPQSPNQQCTLFLTKLDLNGNFVWGKTFGSVFGTLSNALDRVIDMEIGTDGNIYLLADIYERTTFMQKFITIFKVDPQGNILMTKKITNLDYPNQYDIYSSSSLALDNQNNIFITGSYKYRLKIDPTNPLLNFSTGGDSFLLKIDNTGNILWGKKFNVLFLNNHYERVRIDNSQNPIVVASNGDNVTYTNFGYNVFQVSTNNGTILWQKFLDKQNPATFNIDQTGNIIIAGYGKNPTGSDIDVDPGPNTFNIIPTNYLLWLTNNGDFLDVKKYPSLMGYSRIVFSKIELDTNNNTYLVGEFTNVFDADPSSNSFVLDYTCGNGGRDAFYIKFDSNRNFNSAFKLGDYNCNYINFYFTDFKIKNDNQYYVGNFSHTADFDPTPNSFPMTANVPFGSRFTLKLGTCDSSMPTGSINQIFCSSQSATISNLSPNSSSIKWYGSSTSTNQLSNTTPLTDGQTYYASKQIGSCPESQRLAVTVTINQSPAAPISTNQSFCENDNATISSLVASGQNLNWYSTQSGGSVLPPTTTLQNNTTYYASQTVNNCESNRSAVSVTITPNPIPALTATQQFCIQQNATLNNITITGLNIKWYDALTGGNLLASSIPLQNGVTYYASQTINGCESTRVPVTVTIQNTPAPTGNTTQSFCILQNATLNNIVVSGNNITWYSSLTGNNLLPTNTLLINNTTYYASQTVSNCESTNRLAITIALISTLNANDYTETLCDDLNNGFETVDLSDYNTHLISSTANHTFTYYTSQNGAENQSTADAITNFGNYNLTVGLHTVYVRIDSPNGCHQVVELALTLFSKPIIPITDIMPICEGSSIDVSAGNGFDSYTWSTAETTSLITISDPGTYSVTVTQNHGALTCTSVKNFTVVNSNVATVAEIVTSDWTYNQNTITVLLTGSSVGNYVYSLDGIHYQTSNTFTGLESGEYIVYVKDENGCGIQPEDFYLLMYPKFFTPNGDGYNDFWRIKFSENEPNLTIKIFDRYGKLVKQLGRNSEGWNGTYNNQPLPATDYWFTVTRQNGKEYQGHFTLKR